MATLITNLPLHLTSLLVLLVCLAAPLSCPAQMMVRSVPGGDPQSQDRNGLPALADDANGRDALSASANAAGPDGSVVSPGGGAPRPDEDELIREYLSKAGPVGPRKLFSATRLDTTFGVGVFYDDNILLSTGGGSRSDVVTTVVGGVRLSLGDFAQRVNTFAVLSYAGTGNFFARNGSENSYDQDAVVEGLYRFHQLTVGSTSIFQERHDATADFGRRVARDVYSEDFVAKYQRTDRTIFTGALHYDYDQSDEQANTSDLTFTAALDYNLTGKISVGAGAVFGRLTASDDLEEYSQQGQLRLGYTVTNKIKAASSVGLEYRERGSEASDSVTPVFVATVNYTPFVDTVVDLEAHRRTEASNALGGEDYVDTGFQLGVRQGFLKRFYLRLDVGYQNADYKNVTAADSIPRTDNYYSVRSTAGYDFVRWFQVLAFYERRQDESTRGGFSFVSNRVGMAINLNY